jgi:hypothetical protein
MALSSKMLKRVPGRPLRNCRGSISARKYVALFRSRAREQAVFGKVPHA